MGRSPSTAFPTNNAADGQPRDFLHEQARADPVGLLTKALTGLSNRPQSALSKRKRIKSHFPPRGPAQLEVAEESPQAASPGLDAASRPRPPIIPSAPAVDYTRERAAFARTKADLIARYPGKYVVYVGDEMIGPFDDFPTALRSAYRTFGHRAIYTKQLIEDDSVR